MISVQDIVDRMESLLDAESSDRYTFERDYSIAINSSVEWLQAVFNRAFADKKLTEENLKELVKVAVFQTSQFSRVNMSVLSDSVWSILRVNPEPVVYPSTATITATTNPAESIFRDDVSYLSSEYAAKRLSLEEWEENVNNVFEAGNTKLLNDFKSYAYLNHANYESTAYDAGGDDGAEIEIRPAISNKFVGITYLKYPTPITAITDNIEFPRFLTNLVYEKALNFVAVKQGDQTNLWGITENDVNNLVKLMI